MILSAEQIFSDGQVLSATGASTNILDLGATGTVLGAPAALVRDIGKGNQIEISITLDAAATGTTPTLDVDVEVDDNDSFSSATVVASAVQVAGGAAGDSVNLRFVPDLTNERYVRLNYTLGGTTPGYTLTAGVVMGRQSNSSVPGA
jgi:hypothetical protein